MMLSLEYSIFPYSTGLYSVVVCEYAMSVWLPIFEVAHPATTLEVYYSLSFSLIINETTLISLPIVSLKPYKLRIRFVTLLNFTNNPLPSIIFSSSPVKFPIPKFPLISNTFFIPIQFTIAIHLSFNPLTKIKLPIIITIIAFAFPYQFLLRL